MKRTALLLTLLALLFLVSNVLAMQSDNYQLDWFTPLTGGGEAASSPTYATNLTVGQSAIGTAFSTNYDGCLGYWCQATGVRRSVYLPIVLKNGS